MNRRIALALAGAAFALTSFTAPASFAVEPLTCTSDAPCILRVRTVAPKASPWGKLLTLMSKAVKEESKGRLALTIYWQSKSEPSAVRQCLAGKIGGIAVSNGALASAVPEMTATELPYLFDNYAQADKALDAARPLLTEIMGKAGFIYALRGENGFRAFAAKDQFITSPADLAGKAMRSQPAKHHLAMYKALGATPNPIQVAEVPGSLGNNTVTGYDNTLLFADLAGWAAEIKYVTISDHIYQGATVAWCKPWFERLPADLQAVLTEARPKLEKVGLGLVRIFNDKKMPEKYDKDGIQVKKLSAAQKAAFKAATASVSTDFRRETSADGRKLLDLLESSR